MRLVELTCKGFRCLGNVCFRPGQGINVIRGDNAQGKTSLLEAMLFLATSKSHRTGQETDLVRHGEDGFQLRARVERKSGDVSLEANWWKGAKRVKVNGVAQSRMSDILGKINVVFFSPEDVALVRGTAARRRRFLDMELSQLNPGYLRALQRYRQILRQRNELLRSRSLDSASLEAWDVQLAKEGEILTAERAAFVGELWPRAAEAHANVAMGETLSVEYRPDVPPSSFANALRTARITDIKQGITTHGPHRDDIELSVAGKPARYFASQGQQRTAALALKLAELDLVRAHTGEHPILMLDDVLSELDEKRARHLLEAIHLDAQCLITTTSISNRDELFRRDRHVFDIREGRIEETTTHEAR